MISIVEGVVRPVHACRVTMTQTHSTYSVRHGPGRVWARQGVPGLLGSDEAFIQLMGL
jgi:hypothetical protein